MWQSKSNCAELEEKEEIKPHQEATAAGTGRLGELVLSSTT